MKVDVNTFPILAFLLAFSVNALAVDDRGNGATQGAETWSRAAVHMVPLPKLVNGQIKVVLPLKIEVSQLMDPLAPQSPFAQPWSLTPNPTVFFGPNGVTLDSNEAMDYDPLVVRRLRRLRDRRRRARFEGPSAGQPPVR